jgi:carboxyl-terminal processing protease
MKKRERLFWILALLLSLLFQPLSTGFFLSADVNERHKYQQILQNVYFYVSQLYVDPIDEKTLWTGAIRGLLSSTGDPYTRFLDKEEHKEFSGTEGGQKIGIGVEITIKRGVPVVIAPISGGPAEKAGVMAGDLITGIDGKKTENIAFGQLLDMITGESGTDVEIEITREGVTGTRALRITRGSFKIDYVYSEVIENGRVGYLRLSHFFGEESGTINEFKESLLGFRDKGVKSVILDLRNNAGGQLGMAVTLAGYFLKENDLVVSVRGRNAAESKAFRAGNDAGIVQENVPVFVLMNQGSASASEVLAGALQDHKRAVLVGTKSFGKGSVQQLIRPLPDDTAVLVTMQKYYTPNDRSIHGIGLTPDVAVDEFKPTLDEVYYLNQMRDAKFIEDFRRKYSKFSAGTLKAFNEQSQKKGWKFSKTTALWVLRNEYGSVTGKVPDPEIDQQMKKAISLAAGK